MIATKDTAMPVPNGFTCEACGTTMVCDQCRPPVVVEASQTFGAVPPGFVAAITRGLERLRGANRRWYQ